MKVWIARDKNTEYLRGKMMNKQTLFSTTIGSIFWALGIALILLMLFSCNYNYVKPRPQVHHYVIPTNNVTNGITVGTNYGYTTQYITTGYQFNKPVSSITTATSMGSSVMIIHTGNVK